MSSNLTGVELAVLLTGISFPPNSSGWVTVQTLRWFIEYF